MGLEGLSAVSSLSRGRYVVILQFVRFKLKLSTVSLLLQKESDQCISHSRQPTDDRDKKDTDQLKNDLDLEGSDEEEAVEETEDEKGDAVGATQEDKIDTQSQATTTATSKSRFRRTKQDEQMLEEGRRLMSPPEKRARR